MLRSKTVPGSTDTSVHGDITPSEPSPLTSLDSLESVNTNAPSSSSPKEAPPAPLSHINSEAVTTTRSKLLTDSDYFVKKSTYTHSKTAYTSSKDAYTQPKMSSNIATVEHVTTKHCPVLTAGDISPKVMVDLTDAHNEFFLAKEIADADKVKKILGGFRCVHIRDWISCEWEQLVTLSYAAFMTELCENYLPPN